MTISRVSLAFDPDGILVIQIEPTVPEEQSTEFIQQLKSLLFRHDIHVRTDVSDLTYVPSMACPYSSRWTPCASIHSMFVQGNKKKLLYKQIQQQFVGIDITVDEGFWDHDIICIKSQTNRVQMHKM